jgi:nucleoside-diphosphate-sugar epimerase
MRVFVTGASGHIASAVIPELTSAGHSVLGLARSERSVEVVRSLGAEVRRGDLDDLECLTAAAHESDCVIHLAFKHDEMRSGDLGGAAAADLRAIETMGAALQGTGKPFVGTNGLLGLLLAGFRGRLTEHDVWPGGPRIDAENRVIALAEEGVRTSVVRLPPTVHSGGRYGFASGLMAVAQAKGVSGYIGDGTNRWPAVDTRDAGRLYLRALESAPAGSRLHAVAEEGIALRDIAAAIAGRLSVPVAPVAPEDATEHFGYLAAFIGLDAPTSSQSTRALLDWNPAHPGLIADLLQEEGLMQANERSR